MKCSGEMRGLFACAFAHIVRPMASHAHSAILSSAAALAGLLLLRPARS
jgi:hypothetical protein